MNFRRAAGTDCPLDKTIPARRVSAIARSSGWSQGSLLITLTVASRPAAAQSAAFAGRLASFGPSSNLRSVEVEILRHVPAAGRRSRQWLLFIVAFIVAFAHFGCGAPGPTTASGPAPAASPAAAAAPAKAPAAAVGVRDHVLNRATLGPWWGSGCPKNGDCGCGSAETMAEEFTCQMDEIRANDIPVSVYLFDGSAWSERDSRNEGTCAGEDCCSWNLGDEVIERLAREHVRALVHVWGGCHTPEQFGRVRSRLGGSLLGFYLDDGTSDQDLQRGNDYMKSVSPGDFENVAKAYQSEEPSTTDAALSRMANVAYVADLSNDFAGLREGIARVIEKSRLLPAPVNEFTAYDYESGTAPDEATYYRRLHWGAFQPIMAHTPFANSDPWRGEYDAGLLAAYRYYAWLHKELTPYFLSYARRMHEQPELPVIQAGPGAYAMRVGEEIFVPFVTRDTPTLDVQLPAGQWVDYWDEARVVSGNLSEHPAPLGREPVFLKLGAIIPLEVERDYTGHGTRASAGSLTLLVYPSGTSSFRYFDDDTGNWTAFKSVAEGNRLTLSTDSAPAMSLLYRIGRMPARPSSVWVNGKSVLVNQTGSLAESESEAEVNESLANAWFYDAVARRLIVKVAH